MEKLHASVSLLGARPAMKSTIDQEGGVNKAGSLTTTPAKIATPDSASASASAAAAAAAAVAETVDGVRKVTLAEYKQAAKCLAEAFATDDVARYFTHTPDREHCSEAERWELHVSIMEYMVYAHILKGLVLTAGPDYGCVAMWMPPGQVMDDWLTTLRSGLWRLQYKLSKEGKVRFFDEFFPLLHDTKQEVMGSRDDDSYYLVYIGTKATARGKGYARKVIEAVTTKADTENKACYLESSNAINPAIYRKLGFESVKTIGLTRATNKVEMEIMVREPVAVAAEQGFSSAIEKVDSMLDSSVGQLSVSMQLKSSDVHAHIAVS